MPLLYLDPRCYTAPEYFRPHFRGNGPRTRDTVNYRCFWSGRLTRHHKLCLKPLLPSQSPFSKCGCGCPGKPSGAAHAGWPTLAAFRARGCGLTSPRAGRPATRSCAFRALVQVKYGGVYFDMDVLSLKDLRPLPSVEFFWQCSKYPCGNNTISRLRRGSRNVSASVARGLHHDAFFPPSLLRFGDSARWPASAVAFPSFMFSPAWLAHDTRLEINDYGNRLPDFFQNKAGVNLDQFFPDAYADHWHNGWNRPMRQEAIVGPLHRQIVARYAERFGARRASRERGRVER